MNKELIIDKMMKDLDSWEKRDYQAWKSYLYDLEYQRLICLGEEDLENEFADYQE